MKTSSIIKSINSDFAKTYRTSTKFVESGALWDFCMETIKNPIKLSCIVFANDVGVPPVKSLLVIYQREKAPDEDFIFTYKESQYLGTLMGYIFKYVLNYKGQAERCKVEILGVKKATRFLNGPLVNFEK